MNNFERWNQGEALWWCLGIGKWQNGNAEICIWSEGFMMFILGINCLSSNLFLVKIMCFFTQLPYLLIQYLLYSFLSRIWKPCSQISRPINIFNHSRHLNFLLTFRQTINEHILKLIKLPMLLISHLTQLACLFTWYLKTFRNKLP